MKKSILIILSVYLSGCATHKQLTYADEHGALKNASAAFIKLNRHQQDSTLNNQSFPVKYNDSITGLISLLNHATYDGPWKGAGWDEISIATGDSVIVLKTNGKIIGNSNSGWFYTIPTNTFYKDYFGIDIKN